MAFSSRATEVLACEMSVLCVIHQPDARCRPFKGGVGHGCALGVSRPVDILICGREHQAMARFSSSVHSII